MYPTLSEVEAALCRASLWDFVRAAWPVVEPTPLVENWHLELICAELQEVLEFPTGGQLLLTVPPGTAKSLLTSVFAPAWMWTRCPQWRAIFASGNPRVSTRDSIRRRDLISSDWYRETFAPRWGLASDLDTKTLYKNTAGGWHLASTVGSRIVGERADALFVDDPLDVADALSEASRESVIHWFDQAFANRVSQPEKAVRVVIQQRVHEEDLAGHLLEAGGWHHVKLPMEYEPERAYAKDPRRSEGELLFPARFPESVLVAERERLGSSGYAGQMQQRPAPAGGSMLREEWWRYYRELPNAPMVRVQAWDLAVKSGSTNDWSVGMVLGRVGAAHYVIDLVRLRADFPGQIAAVKSLSARHPLAVRKLVEDAANGAPLIASLKGEVDGLVPVRPVGNKESRVAAVSPLIEAGNVYLPDPALAPWVRAFVAECTAFPRGRHDDQVDALSMGLAGLRQLAEVKVMPIASRPRHVEL